MCDQVNQMNVINDEEAKFIYQTSKSKWTLNKHGKMSLTEIPHFTLAKQIMNPSRPILEMGCAYGFTTKALLKEGYHVIANDIEKGHLDSLYDSIENESEKSRLTLKHGNLMDLDFEDNSLNGIIGINVIHFLEGNEIRSLFNRCYRWLAPGGILNFSAASVFSVKSYANTEIGRQRLKDYFRNLKNNVEWPGEHYSVKSLIDEGIFDTNILFKYIPERTHLLCAEIMTREANLAGFNVLKVEYFDEDENGYREPKNLNRMIFVSIMCIKEDL